MRILLVTSMFPPYYGGGVSSHVNDLAVSLKRMGDEPWILTTRRGQLTRKDERTFVPEGVRIVYSARFSGMFLKIGRMIRENDFDIVHYHCFNTLSLDSLNRRGKPGVACTIHSISSDFLASTYGWSINHPAYQALKMFEKHAIIWPDSVIAISKKLYKYAKDAGVSKVTYIPNSVDCEFWKPAPKNDYSKPDNIIFLPVSLIPLKGIEYALRAMPIILREVPNARMVIAGDGPLRDHLESLAIALNKSWISESRQLNSQNKDHNDHGVFSFLGNVPRSKMRELYWNSNVVLMPSISSTCVPEGISIAALEAMACEKTLITSSMEGMREVIADGKNGIFVPEKDPTAIAESVIRVLKTRDLADHIGRAARECVLNEFSLPIWIRRIKEAYELTNEDS